MWLLFVNAFIMFYNAVNDGCLFPPRDIGSFLMDIFLLTELLLMVASLVLFHDDKKD